MKKLKYTIQALLTGIILLLSGSCSKKFLDSAPYGTVSDENFYLTTDQCMGAVMQCYNRTVHLGPIYLFIRHGLNDYAGDDNLRNTTDEFTVWNNFSADNVQLLWGWKYCFQGIYLCNYTLSKLTTSPIPQADKDRLGAECKSIRALMYYMVATRYGTTPIITEPLEPSEYYLQKFQNAEEVYGQVIKDLTEAIPFLPNSWDNSNKGRLSAAADKFMLAKTYLQLAGYPINKAENWQKASDVLAEFVPADKRGDYSLGLLPNYGDVFTKAHDQSVESVFEVNEMYLPGPGADVSLEVGAPGNFFQAFYQPNVYEGYGGWDCTTADLHDEFEKDNSGNIIDRRYPYTMLDPGDIFYVTTQGDTLLQNSAGKTVITNVQVNHTTNTATYNIKSASTETINTFWPGLNKEYYPAYKYMRNSYERTGLLNGHGLFGEDLNIKWMRFSDAVLMYAECLNETGHTADAATYLNEVRARANASASVDPRRIYQKTIVTGTLPMVSAGVGQDSMRSAIQHESRVELAGEDWRYENLRRWGIAEKRLHQMAARSPKIVNGSDNPAAKYTSPSWDYMPVPASEYKP